MHPGIKAWLPLATTHLGDKLNRAVLTRYKSLQCYFSRPVFTSVCLTFNPVTTRSVKICCNALLRQQINHISPILIYSTYPPFINVAFTAFLSLALAKTNKFSIKWTGQKKGGDHCNISEIMSVIFTVSKKRVSCQGSLSLE